MTSTVLSSTHHFLTISLFIFSVLRLNILWMGLRWDTVPSTSSTGWTGRSWLWAWLISCQPVYLLSTCTTTQIMPHCRWAPILLSGQPSCLFSKIKTTSYDEVDLSFRVCTIRKNLEKAFSFFFFLTKISQKRNVTNCIKYTKYLIYSWLVSVYIWLNTVSGIYIRSNLGQNRHFP